MAVPGRRPLRNLLSTTLRFGSEEDAILFCHSCEQRGKTVNANGYCQNCRANLCDNCILSHRKSAPTKNHVVSKISVSTSTGVTSDKLQNCSTHPKEEIQLYCRAHGTVGCIICMTLSHKLCEIDYIPEVSKQFVKGKEYLSFEENVNDLKHRCAIGMSKIETNVVDIEETSSNIISSIENIRKGIIERLDRFENELKKEVTEYRKNSLAKMETLKKDYEKLVRNVTGIDDGINRLRRDHKYNSLFCEIRQAIPKIPNLQGQTYELSKRLCIQKCRLQKTEELNTLLKKAEIFGKIHVNDAALGPSNVPESVTTEPVCHINIKSKTDKKTCYATGLAFISSDQLAVADKANKNVKIVDISYDKMISEITLSSSPRDITVIPPDQLAVTLRDEKVIQILSTASGLTRKEMIKTIGNCRGIKFVNGNLIVTFEKFAFPKIQELTTKGEVLRTTEQSDEGQLFLAEPKCIGVTPDHTHMYVTDLKKRLVYRLSESQKLTSSSRKTHYMGIAVSGGGSVYACAKTDDAVFQMTDDLSEQRVVLGQKNGIRGPIALAISHEKNMLVVSCGNGDAEVCDKLHLFIIRRSTK